MTTSVAILTALSITIACGDKDNDDTAPDTQTDGGGTDGGTADGGGDGGGTTGDGGTPTGACIECHGDEELLQENAPVDTGEAHEEPSGEG